ncbi:unnamed protein product [Danaus chrysippus]|uniref:(African queen) hypothetical protein n=1 Tax=Danaus chrysippus TaxID=151541 RepID=A0A8J2QM13_9NEOP|nr:unnamed protein product [Danaus chrysippus]
MELMETLAPVISCSIRRMLFSVVAEYYIGIIQIDVKNVFMNCSLLEDLLVEQPDGFFYNGEEKPRLYIESIKRSKASKMQVHAVVGVLGDDTDPMVSVMKLEKAPQETYEVIGGLDTQIREIKVLIRVSLQNYVCKELHSSHLGIPKVKAEARKLLWFPSVDAVSE